MLDGPMVDGGMFFAPKGEVQDFILSPKDQCLKFKPTKNSVIEPNGIVGTDSSSQSNTLDARFISLRLNHAQGTDDINHPDTLKAFEELLRFNANLGDYDKLSKNTPVLSRINQISNPEIKFRLSKVLLEGLNNSVVRLGKLNSADDKDMVSALNEYYKYSRKLTTYEESLPKGFKNTPEKIARDIIDQNHSIIRLIPKNFEGEIKKALKNIRGENVEDILKKLADSNLSPDQKKLLRNRSYAIALIIKHPELVGTTLRDDFSRKLLETALQSDTNDYKLPGVAEEIEILLKKQKAPARASELDIQHMRKDFKVLARNIIYEQNDRIIDSLDKLLSKEIKWSWIKPNEPRRTS